MPWSSFEVLISVHSSSELSVRSPSASAKLLKPLQSAQNGCHCPTSLEQHELHPPALSLTLFFERPKASNLNPKLPGLHVKARCFLPPSATFRQHGSCHASRGRAAVLGVRRRLQQMDIGLCTGALLAQKAKGSHSGSPGMQMHLRLWHSGP